MKANPKQVMLDVKELIDNMRQCNDKDNCKKCKERYECIRHTRYVLSWILEVLIAKSDDIDRLSGMSYT